MFFFAGKQIWDILRLRMIDVIMAPKWWQICELKLLCFVIESSMLSSFVPYSRTCGSSSGCNCFGLCQAKRKLLSTRTAGRLRIRASNWDETTDGDSILFQWKYQKKNNCSILLLSVFSCSNWINQIISFSYFTTSMISI